jgi:hypothetical protein
MNSSPNPRQRNFVVGLIIIGLMVIVFFGLRAVHAFRQFQDHRPPPPFATRPVETDVNLIRNWMTIPFVAKMYDVRPHLLFETLDIPEQGNHEKSLQQLNAEYFPEAEGLLLEKIKAAVRAALSAKIPPGTPVFP